MTLHLRVIQHDVRDPDVISSHPHSLDPPVIIWIPCEILITPFLKGKVDNPDITLQLLPSTTLYLCTRNMYAHEIALVILRNHRD